MLNVISLLVTHLRKRGKRIFKLLRNSASIRDNNRTSLWMIRWKYLLKILDRRQQMKVCLNSLLNAI